MRFPQGGYAPILPLFWSALIVVLALADPGVAQQSDKEQLAADEALLRSVDISPAGPALLEHIRQRCQRTLDDQQIRALVNRLGDEEFATRQQATARLLEVGLPARSFLRAALSHSDIEVLRRAEYCLEQIDKVSGPTYLAAMVRVLARRAPEGSLEVLFDFLPLVESEEVREEVARALVRLGFPGGMPHPLLVRALEADQPILREVAAWALVLQGSPTARDQARGLLGDPEPLVRRRIALALLRAQDRSSLPVLIDLLAELDPEQVWSIEDALYQVAGDNAPTVSLGSTLASRQAARDAWKKWWTSEGKDINLARVATQTRLLGFTLVVVQDLTGRKGKVLELDPDGKVRWELDTSRYPVDAQVLDEDRILVADYSTRMVTEYDRKGKVLWQKQGPNSVLGARRLRNGNTFIVTRNQIVELDQAGKTVLSLSFPTPISAATKMRNGNIAVVDSSGRFKRLDRSGKSLREFVVGTMYALGSNIQVLPSGGVLVPLYASNAVAEFDARGKEVWRASATRPTSVQRLPNGNTLIGSRLQKSLVEVDRQGKQVWRYTASGRVMGVSRR